MESLATLADRLGMSLSFILSRIAKPGAGKRSVDGLRAARPTARPAG